MRLGVINKSVAAIFIISGLAFADLSAAARQNGPEKENKGFVEYVDTKIGAVDKRASNCVIGPMLPYGSINPSPHTENGGMDGYNPEYPIRGFGQLHVSGTGWSSYGHFLLCPQVGLSIAADGHDSPHSGDVTKAYYYKTDLDGYGISVEVAPSHYSTIYRIRYPKSDESYLMFDAAHSVVGDIATEMHGTVIENEASVDPETGKIRMMIRFRGGWPGGPYNLYLAGRFDRKAEEAGVWKGTEIMPGKHEIRKDKADEGHLGTYCRFSTEEGDEVILKLALSFTGYENAERLLQREIPDWDFDRVKEEGRNVWNEKLASIAVDTDSETDKTIFYSAMFRSLTLARDRSLDNSKWNSGLPFWDDNYAFWDTFRTAYPLLVLIDEDAIRDNIIALIDRFEHNGCVYDGFVAQIDRKPEQGGNDVDNVIVDAYLKGVKGVDWKKAYEIVKYNADNRRIGHSKANDTTGLDLKYKEQGWIPQRTMSSSQTLEFAYNDYCAALMAKGLGKRSDYRKYSQRSHKWVNIWNPDLESHGYKGFIDARAEDGTFAFINATKSGGSWNSPFYEGSSWTYSYYVPHDFETLIRLMGGEERFVERLDHGFRSHIVNYLNEPGFLAPRTFAHAGRPDLLSYWVHSIMHRSFDLQGYPSNDDTGSMGSWFVFSSIGIFPNAGQDYYYLNAPLFRKSTVRLSGGKTLEIVANSAPENVYIKSCKINGKEWNVPVIKHSDIAKGGVIEFELSDKPTSWGTDVKSLNKFLKK